MRILFFTIALLLSASVNAKPFKVTMSEVLLSDVTVTLKEDCKILAFKTTEELFSLNTLCYGKREVKEYKMNLVGKVIEFNHSKDQVAHVSIKMKTTNGIDWDKLKKHIEDGKIIIQSMDSESEIVLSNK